MASRRAAATAAAPLRDHDVVLAADFRNDNGDAARNADGSVAEIRRYLAAGLDAFFTDDPALGRQAIEQA